MLPQHIIDPAANRSVTHTAQASSGASLRLPSQAELLSCLTWTLRTVSQIPHCCGPCSPPSKLCGLRSPGRLLKIKPAQSLLCSKPALLHDEQNPERQRLATAQPRSPPSSPLSARPHSLSLTLLLQPQGLFAGPPAHCAHARCRAFPRPPGLFSPGCVQRQPLRIPQISAKTMLPQGGPL